MNTSGDEDDLQDEHDPNKTVNHPFDRKRNHEEPFIAEPMNPPITKVVHRNVLDSDFHRRLSIDLLFWEILKEKSFLQVEEDSITLRSFNNGLVSMFTYSGTPSALKGYYEFAKRIFDKQVAQTLGYEVDTTFVVSRVLMEYLTEHYHLNFDGIVVRDKNYHEVILSLGLIVETALRGDVERLKEVMDKRMKYLLTSVSPPLK